MTYRPAIARRRKPATGNRNLALLAVSVAGFALLLGGWLFLSVPSRTPHARGTEEAAADSSRFILRSPSPLTSDRSEPEIALSPARLLATLTPKGDEQRPAAAQGPVQLPEQKNPRALLKKTRRQAKSGEAAAALATAREILPLVHSEVNRNRLATRLDEADSALRNGQAIDFDLLMELIETTVAPDSWDTVGGPGSMQEFAPGVYMDLGGLLHRVQPDTMPELADLRQNARQSAASQLPPDINQPSALRKVSLPRLEREVARRLASGERLTDDIRYLAGLTQVHYLLIYPEDGDVVLAGPAEPWKLDEYGRAVGADSGWPMLQLDDMVVLLRACLLSDESDGILGCGIYPRRERLEQVQEFLAASAATGPIRPDQRELWLERLRAELGHQDIHVFGVRPGSRVAHVMVEADYRMKLVGIGLEPAAVPGIPSYFELLGTPDLATLSRPINTLRWWFTLKEEPILATPERDAFQLAGPYVEVLSENELLTRTGERVHTGWSEPVNEQFAGNFTEHYAELAAEDPSYANLANVFDLSIVAALLRDGAVPETISWDMGCFADPDEYLILLQPAPRTVETVLNHHVYRGRYILAAISGGVRIDPWKLVRSSQVKADIARGLTDTRTSSRAPKLPDRRWWWN